MLAPNYKIMVFGSSPSDTTGQSWTSSTSIQTCLFPARNVGNRSTLSMAPRSWATGAEESCTTRLMTVMSKLVGVVTLQEQEETASTLGSANCRRPVTPRSGVPGPKRLSLKVSGG